MSRFVLPVSDSKIYAGAQLEPSGDHKFEVEIERTGYQLAFSQSQAKWLRKAIDEFLNECNFDDCKPNDRQFRKKIHLMQKQGG